MGRQWQLQSTMKINFSDQFETLAAKHGDREALVNVERNRRYTFTELHKLTNQIVNMISGTLSLGEGDRFINILHNDNMALLHVLTILKANATGVFTNSRDSLDEHISQVDLVEPKVAFIENALLDSHYPMLRARGVTVVCMDPIDESREGLLYFWDLLEGVSDKNPNIEIDDCDHMMLIRFTGGTTGKGKAAYYCPQNWLCIKDSFYAMPDSDWEASSRLLHISPISHGTMLPLMPCFFSGGCSVTLNEPDLAKFCQTVEREKITHSFSVPTVLYRLLELPQALESDLSSLRSVFYGAAPMSPSKLKLLQEKFGNIFIQVYASTEHLPISLSLSKQAHQLEGPEGESKLSAIGQVVSGIEVILMDDNGQPVEVGSPGEIWMRSRGTIDGYYKNPEATEAEFIDGYWKSGDIAYQDDQGFIFMIDRKKDMIITGGFNVYSVEVESAINAHEAVLNCAVIGVPHEEWGESVHAEVILRDSMSVDEKELIAFVKEKLGGYKSPKSIKYVDQLPVSAVGKVLRREVRDKYWKKNERQLG